MNQKEKMNSGELLDEFTEEQIEQKEQDGGLIDELKKSRKKKIQFQLMQKKEKKKL